MHEQDVAGAEIRHEIFGAAAEPGHGLAGQPSDEVLLKGKAQVFPPGFGVQNFCTLHDGLQAAADSLDFGQFGHGEVIHLMKVT
jgi:hypothetical protein